ncbi:MAG: hypothetical protein ABJG14_22385 [Sulfitobacter sp.]
MQADECAEIAWANSIKESVQLSVGGALIVGVLKNPFLRHLMELYLNNSVTSLGASVLVRHGLAEVHGTCGREEWCRGYEFGTIELNSSGFSCFNNLRDQNGEEAWFDLLVEGITAYACRDAGEGICLGREHLATAIENRDQEILRRVVEPVSTSYSFEELSHLDIFTDEARLATEKFWSPNFQGRRSAKILRSSFEFNRPVWSLEDENDAIAICNRRIRTTDCLA